MNSDAAPTTLPVKSWLGKWRAAYQFITSLRKSTVELSDGCVRLGYILHLTADVGQLRTSVFGGYDHS